jgi:NifU-like protein involved in Fe-S cluster formation
MLTELAKGKTIEEAKLITDDDVVEVLGGDPRKEKALLAAGCPSVAGRD